MTKEDLPSELQPWWGHTFSSGGYGEKAYLKFQGAYKQWLKKALRRYSVKMYGGRYEFSVVVTRKGADGKPDRHVYLSISDVRDCPHWWARHVRARTMAHAKDRTGGPTTYCDVNGIPERVDRLMTQMDKGAAA
jgi:hypothetical protein